MTAGARSILITGCSSGIGEAAARAFAARGYRVFATVRREEDIDRLRGSVEAVLFMDMADSRSIRDGVAACMAALGGSAPDAVFLNAGYGQPGAVEDVTRDVMREQFECNLFGPHELLTLILPGMRARGSGRIVFNSSVLGFAALKFRGAYAASKFAAEGLFDTLRLELDGSGISACLLEPGPIATRFRERALLSFDRHVSGRPSVHAQAYVRLRERLAKEGPVTSFTLPPESCVSPLIHAVESVVPKTRYRVTTPTKLFAILKRLLPSRWLDIVLAKGF